MQLCYTEAVAIVQVYAVSGTSPTASGSLHVLHGSQVVDTLFQSAPDYQGVTGLWAIPMTPTEVCAALIIISFASGSRAMTAGARCQCCLCGVPIAAAVFLYSTGICHLKVLHDTLDVSVSVLH